MCLQRERERYECTFRHETPPSDCLLTRYVHDFVTSKGHFFPDFTEDGSCDSSKPTSSCVSIVPSSSTRSHNHLSVDVSGAFDASDAGPLYMRLLVRTACFEPSCLSAQYFPVAGVVKRQAFCHRVSPSTLQSVFPQLDVCYALSDLVQVATIEAAAPVVIPNTTAIVITSDRSISLCATGITTSSAGILELFQNCLVSASPSVETCTSVQTYAFSSATIDTTPGRSCLTVSASVAVGESVATVGPLFATLSVSGQQSNVTQIGQVQQAVPTVNINLATLSQQGTQSAFEIVGEGFDSIDLSANNVVLSASTLTASFSNVVVTGATSQVLTVKFDVAWLERGDLKAIVSVNGISSTQQVVGWLGDVVPTISSSNKTVTVSTTSISLHGFNLGANKQSAIFSFHTSAVPRRVVQGLTEEVNSTFAKVAFAVCVPSLGDNTAFGTIDCSDLS